MKSVLKNVTFLVLALSTSLLVSCSHCGPCGSKQCDMKKEQCKMKGEKCQKTEESTEEKKEEVK